MKLPKLTLVVVVCLVTILISVWPQLAGARWPTVWLFSARLTAGLAFTLFSLNFLLATRAHWLNRLIGGLDRVYIQHHISGGLAFIFMLLHPAFLMINALPERDIALSYLTPSFPDGAYEYFLATGRISLYAVTVLLILTLYIRLPYHIWKWSHVLMGLVYFPLVYHLIWNPNLADRNPALYTWFLLLAGIGITSFLYRRFLYRFLAAHRRYTVAHVESKGAGIAEVTLTLVPNQRPHSFEPGQFGFFTIEKAGLREKHPFSFTSAPGKTGELRFAFRSLGDYTTRLTQKLRAGDPVTVYGPYGVFGERFLGSKKPAVLIAGGIGITPFLSFLHNEHHHPRKRPVHLFYSAKSRDEAVFDPELASLSRQLNHLDYHLHLTDQEGFLTLDHVMKELGDQAQSATYFLCGPPTMMTALRQQAAAHGIAPRQIVFEEFTLYQ